MPVRQLLRAVWLNAPPPTENTLCKSAASLSLFVGWQTVHSHLSTLRFYQISSGLPDPSYQSFPRLSYFLKSVHCFRPGHLHQQRLPITPSILKALFIMWSSKLHSFDNRMLWAACCLGFFGFIHAWKFTSNPNGHTGYSLSTADISLDSRSSPKAIIIHLQYSKTDLFVAGCYIHLGRTYHQLFLCQWSWTTWLLDLIPLALFSSSTTGHPFLDLAWCPICNQLFDGSEFWQAPTQVTASGLAQPQQPLRLASVIQ